jgi:hypothetical protein
LCDLLAHPLKYPISHVPFIQLPLPLTSLFPLFVAFSPIPYRAQGRKLRAEGTGHRTEGTGQREERRGDFGRGGEGEGGAERRRGEERLEDERSMGERAERRGTGD